MIANNIFNGLKTIIKSHNTKSVPIEMFIE